MTHQTITIAAELTFQGFVISEKEDDAPLATVQLSAALNALTSEQKTRLAIALKDAVVSVLTGPSE